MLKVLVEDRYKAKTDSESEDDTCSQSQASTQTEDQSQPTNQEADASKLLLNKYIKKMNLGDVQIQFKQNIPFAKDPHSQLKIIEGPDNARQVSLELDGSTVAGKADKKTTKVYDELIKLLQSHTNFDELGDQQNYLSALGDLVEVTFDKADPSLSAVTLDKLDQLAKVLKPRGKDEHSRHNEDDDEDEEESSATFEQQQETPPKGDMADMDSVEGGKSYATVEDLEEQYHPEYYNSRVEIAPDHLNLKKGQALIDNKGVMYVRRDEYSDNIEDIDIKEMIYSDCSIRHPDLDEPQTEEEVAPEYGDKQCASEDAYSASEDAEIVDDISKAERTGESAERFTSLHHLDLEGTSSTHQVPESQQHSMTSNLQEDTQHDTSPDTSTTPDSEAEQAERDEL